MAIAHLALSGGTTPARTYELLASELTDWDGIEVWFADERCVGPDDEESNYRLARETLLSAAGVPDERVHRMEGELGPEEGAERYARMLRERVAAEAEGQAGARALGDTDAVPALDVVVLGIGPDGHVASLFPGAPTLDADARAVCLPRARLPEAPARAHHAEPAGAPRGAGVRAAGHERVQGRRGRRDAGRAEPSRPRQPAAARPLERDRRRRRGAPAAEQVTQTAVSVVQ